MSIAGGNGKHMGKIWTMTCSLTPRRTIMRTRAVFPFTAIVGQESIKVALLLNAISPLIGGGLIRGHKGTAKSTAVRALSRLLPDIEVVAGCPFACALSEDP